MLEQKFKKGDVVELNSGNPPMTVADVRKVTMVGDEPSYTVDVEWIDSNGLPHAGSYDQDMLKFFEAKHKAVGGKRSMGVVALSTSQGRRR